MKIKNILIIFILLIISLCNLSYGNGFLTNKKEKVKSDNIENYYNSKKEIGIFIILIREYMKQVMVEYNKPLSNKDFNKYHYEHALAHLEVLLKRFENGSTTTRRDISYQEAAEINKKAFAACDMPFDAWFFADVFDVLDHETNQKIWDDMLNALANDSHESEKKVFLFLWNKMKNVSDLDKIEKSKRWLNRLEFVIISFKS
ncbi:hypothetical protein [Providencia sp.]|nr:hypothetical protein [Providencia rettgeri]HEM8139017.1 hypothetical protein [Providencia rettgeri]